jgi:hypothetical protein
MLYRFYAILRNFNRFYAIFTQHLLRNHETLCTQSWPQAHEHFDLEIGPGMCYAISTQLVRN